MPNWIDDDGNCRFEVNGVPCYKSKAGCPVHKTPQGPSPILVWPWQDAPKDLQELSEHGGDEDWVALVPEAYADMYILWIEAGRGFGVCDVQKIQRADGSVVFIGAHA